MPRVGLGRGQLRVRGPRSEHLHKRAGKLVEVYLFASYASPKVHGRVQISNLGIEPLGIYNSSGLAKRARFVIASSGVYDDPLVLGRPEAFRGNSIRVGAYEGIKHHAELIVIAYRRYNTDIRIVRIFRSYGPSICSGRLTKDVEARPPVGVPQKRTVPEIAGLAVDLARSEDGYVYKPPVEDDLERRYPDISRTGEYLDGKSHFGVRDGSSKILERSVLRANRPGKVSPAQG